MASTEAGTALTEQHRRAQLRLRAAFLKEFTRLWPLLDLDQLDEATVTWIDLATELILNWRNQSAARALAYYDTFRRAEIGEPLPDRALYANLAIGIPDQIRTSLLVTGPVGVKSYIAKGLTPTRAKRMAFTAVAGAASRHVLNGSRKMIIATAIKDQMAVRYSRVTDDDPCAFCAMLAGRGPDYFSRATAHRTTSRSKRGAGEKYHDDCACTVEVSFDRISDWPARNREFEQIWKDSTGGYSGKNAINAFRRAYEAQRKSK